MFSMRDMIVFKRFWLAIAIELSFRSLWNQIYKGAQLHTLARSISDMILLSCASNNDERQQPRNANKNTHTHTQANQSLQIWNSMLFAAWHSFNTHQESFRALIYVTLCIAGESLYVSRVRKIANAFEAIEFIQSSVCAALGWYEFR